MKKLLFVILLGLSFACEKKETIKSSSIDFENRKNDIKQQSQLYVEVMLNSLRSNPFPKDQSSINNLFSNENFQKVQPSVNFLDITKQIEFKLKNKKPNIKISKHVESITQELYSLNQTTILSIFNTHYNSSKANLKVLSSNDSIQSAFIDTYLDEYNSKFVAQLMLKETSIENDSELSENEKLALIAATTTLAGYMPTVLKLAVKDFSRTNPIDGRVQSFWSKFIPSVLNFTATIVANVIEYAIPMAIFGLVGFGPVGCIVGACIGGLYGIVEGGNAYFDNYGNIVCVVCQSFDKKTPCYDYQCALF